LAVSFFGAYFTAEFSIKAVHEFFAFACLTLVTFRALWGLVGSENARFSNFVKGRQAVTAYAKGLLRLKHETIWGHNPLGAVAILLILGLMFALVGAGLFASDAPYFGPWAQSVAGGFAKTLGGLHELLANVLMAVVAGHIVAVLAYRVFLRDNLITPMVTGLRDADEEHPEPRFTANWIAIVLFLISLAGSGAVFRYWVL
jgi:cytochrome b